MGVPQNGWFMEKIPLTWMIYRYLYFRTPPFGAILIYFLRNMAVLKVRMTFLFASHQAGAFALSPIAGVISQFGLFWPW